MMPMSRNGNHRPVPMGKNARAPQGEQVPVKSLSARELGDLRALVLTQGLGAAERPYVAKALDDANPNATRELAFSVSVAPKGAAGLGVTWGHYTESDGWTFTPAAPDPLHDVGAARRAIDGWFHGHDSWKWGGLGYAGGVCQVVVQHRLHPQPHVEAVVGVMEAAIPQALCLAVKFMTDPGQQSIVLGG